MGDVPRSMLLLAGILLIEILFYGFGAAIQELGSSELSRRKEEGDRRAAGILKILEKPFSYAGVVQAVSGVGGLINGAVLLKTAERLLLHSFSNKQIPAGILTGITVVLAAVLLLTVFLSVGVALPKRLAAHAPEAWAYRLYPAIRVLSLLFYPLVCLVSGVSAILARLFGVRPGEDTDSVTEEDIMSMVNEGHEQGVIKADEAEMITNIFEFDDKEAGDIMTHRTGIQALSADLTLDQAVTEMLSGERFKISGVPGDPGRCDRDSAFKGRCALAEAEAGRRQNAFGAFRTSAHRPVYSGNKKCAEAVPGHAGIEASDGSCGG